jgi:hypothetical protein
MSDKIFIQHRFTVKKVGSYDYSDAIVLPKEEYEKLTEGEIEAMKEERWANWDNLIKPPPVQPEPTKEDLEAQVKAIDEQIATLTAQKEATNVTLTAKRNIIDKIVGVIGGK